MTLADLLRLEQRMSAGPWEAVRLKECLIQPHVQQVKTDGGRYTICTPVHSNEATMRNMVGIAASRNVLRELVEVARATEFDTSDSAVNVAIRSGMTKTLAAAIRASHD